MSLAFEDHAAAIRKLFDAARFWFINRNNADAENRLMAAAVDYTNSTNQGVIPPHALDEWKNKAARLQSEIQRLELKIKALENASQEYDCSTEKSYPAEPPSP